MRGIKRTLTTLLCMTITISYMPLTAAYADEAKSITFTDSEVTLSSSITSGVTASGTDVTITEAGEYVLSGSCSDGHIEVAETAGTVTLTLNGISLTSTSGQAISIATTTSIISVANGTENTVVAKKAAIKSIGNISFQGSGELNVSSTNKDGINSNGDITIGGDLTLKINARAGDAIQADHDLSITGGTLNLTTNGGYINASDTDTESYKGIKADNDLTISGGNITVNSADDAVHSNGSLSITGGTFIIQSGDDGIHADTTLTIGDDNGGNPTINIMNSYEGIEAPTVSIYSGDIDVAATDDGINAGDGNETRGNFYINIYGGDIYVNAEGDGLDSNGYIKMDGGKLVVFGQEAGHDNSALDYEYSCTVNGGTLFAAGGQGMGRPNIVGTQGSKSVNLQAQKGDTIKVYSGTTEIFSIESVKTISNVVFSSSTQTNISIVNATNSGNGNNGGNNPSGNGNNPGGGALPGDNNGGGGSGGGAASQAPEETHNLVLVPAVAATCTEDGNTAYYKCTDADCGKYFSDAEGKNEIAENSWILKATGHKLTLTQATEAGLLKDGNTAYWTCENCGKYFGDAEAATELEKDSWVINGYATSYVKSMKLAAGKKSGKRYIKVTWTRRGATYQKEFNGYEIKYWISGNKTNAKTTTATKSSSGKKLTSLSSKKMYYVQVRTYTVSNGKTYYSNWTTKSAKTK